MEENIIDKFQEKYPVLYEKNKRFLNEIIKKNGVGINDISLLKKVCFQNLSFGSKFKFILKNLKKKNNLIKIGTIIIISTIAGIIIYTGFSPLLVFLIIGLGLYNLWRKLRD